MSEQQPAAPSAPAPSEAPVENSEVVESLPEEELSAEQQQLEEAEKKALKKKFQLKVNNKVKDLELDLGNDEEIQKYLQKAMAADEKFQEAATLRKQVEQLVSELKKNPLAILKHPELGIDVKALAQSVLNEEIEEMQLTPEQKKIRDLENALKEKEEREKEALKQKEELERARFEQEAMEKLDDDITQALSKSNLPKSPYVVRRMADTMLAAMEMTDEKGNPLFTDVTAEQVLPFVEEQILGEINRLFESAPEDTFDKMMESVIGKKNLDKYRKAKVAKTKSAPKTTTAAQVKDTGASNKSKESPKEEPPKRFKDIFKTF